MVSEGFLPIEPGARGRFGVTITHPGPADLETAFPASRPLGPHAMAPWMVTSRVRVNDIDAYLIYNSQGRTGVLEIKVGRILVGVQGGDVSPEAVTALARSLNTAALHKY